MRVLLDTDVILDFLLERSPFFEASSELLELNANGIFDAYISGITPINVFYIGRKIVGAPKIRQGIADLLKLVRISSVTQESLEEALGLPFADYEDAVQHAVATNSGPIAIVGYTFDGTWAARNRSAVDRFLAATRQAKEILASSEVEWQRLALRIRVTDPNALAIYRQRYGEGIVRRPLADEEADARALYHVLAEVGGTELVGPARELDRGTFYRPAAGN